MMLGSNQTPQSVPATKIHPFFAARSASNNTEKLIKTNERIFTVSSGSDSVKILDKVPEIISLSTPNDTFINASTPIIIDTSGNRPRRNAAIAADEKQKKLADIESVSDLRMFGVKNSTKDPVRKSLFPQDEDLKGVSKGNVSASKSTSKDSMFFKSKEEKELIKLQRKQIEEQYLKEQQEEEERKAAAAREQERIRAAKAIEEKFKRSIQQDVVDRAKHNGKLGCVDLASVNEHCEFFARRANLSASNVNYLEKSTDNTAEYEIFKQVFYFPRDQCVPKMIELSNASVLDETIKEGKDDFSLIDVTHKPIVNEFYKDILVNRYSEQSFVWRMWWSMFMNSATIIFNDSAKVGNLAAILDEKLFPKEMKTFCENEGADYFSVYQWLDLRARRLRQLGNSTDAAAVKPKGSKRKYEDNDFLNSSDEEFDDYCRKGAANGRSAGGSMSPPLDSSDDGFGNVLILQGPVSSGKTSILYACAEELRLNVIEINVSQSRTSAEVRKVCEEALKSRGVTFGSVTVESEPSPTAGDGKKVRVLQDEDEDVELVGISQSVEKGSSSIKDLNLILFDDIDIHFEEEDSGFYSAIVSLIRDAKCPVVITCSESMNSNMANPVLSPVEKLYKSIVKDSEKPPKVVDLCAVHPSITRKLVVSAVESISSSVQMDNKSQQCFKKCCEMLNYLSGNDLRGIWYSLALLITSSCTNNSSTVVVVDADTETSSFSLKKSGEHSSFSIDPKYLQMFDIYYIDSFEKLPHISCAEQNCDGVVNIVQCLHPEVCYIQPQIVKSSGEHVITVHGRNFLSLKNCMDRTFYDLKVILRSRQSNISFDRELPIDSSRVRVLSSSKIQVLLPVLPALGYYQIVVTFPEVQCISRNDPLVLNEACNDWIIAIDYAYSKANNLIGSSFASDDCIVKCIKSLGAFNSAANRVYTEIVRESSSGSLMSIKGRKCRSNNCLRSLESSGSLEEDMNIDEEFIDDEEASSHRRVVLDENDDVEDSKEEICAGSSDGEEEDEDWICELSPIVDFSVLSEGCVAPVMSPVVLKDFEDVENLAKYLDYLSSADLICSTGISCYNNGIFDEYERKCCDSKIYEGAEKGKYGNGSQYGSSLLDESLYSVVFQNSRADQLLEIADYMRSENRTLKWEIAEGENKIENCHDELPRKMMELWQKYEKKREDCRKPFESLGMQYFSAQKLCSLYKKSTVPTLQFSYRRSGNMGKFVKALFLRTDSTMTLYGEVLPFLSLMLKIEDINYFERLDRIEILRNSRQGDDDEIMDFADFDSYGGRSSGRSSRSAKKKSTLNRFSYVNSNVLEMAFVNELEEFLYTYWIPLSL